MTCRMLTTTIGMIITMITKHELENDTLGLAQSMQGDTV